MGTDNSVPSSEEVGHSPCPSPSQPQTLRRLDLSWYKPLHFANASDILQGHALLRKSTAARQPPDELRTYSTSVQRRQGVAGQTPAIFTQVVGFHDFQKRFTGQRSLRTS